MRIGKLPANDWCLSKVCKPSNTVLPIRTAAKISKVCFSKPQNKAGGVSLNQSTTLPIMANKSASNTPNNAVSKVIPASNGRMPAVQFQTKIQKCLGGGLMVFLGKGLTSCSNLANKVDNINIYRFSIKQTASVAMPSPRPVKPNFSVVVALILI